MKTDTYNYLVKHDTETLYEGMQNNEPVNTDLIYGHVNTPIIPDEVFDKEKYPLKSGKIYIKKIFNESKFYDFIESRIEANQGNDIKEKVIVGSQFANNIRYMLNQINRGEIVKDPKNGDFVPCECLYEGRLSPIHIPADKAEKWIETLRTVTKTAYTPKSIHSTTSNSVYGQIERDEM